MSAMVDKGGGGGSGGRDVLKSYNPPPSYASVLSGRRNQSFFGGSPPLLPSRNSTTNSPLDLGRHDKRLTESVTVEQPTSNFQAEPSTASHSAPVSTISAGTATSHSNSSNSSSSSSTSPAISRPVERMEESPALTQEMKPQNQALVPDSSVSFENALTDANESPSSRTNVDEKLSLDSSNFEPSRNRKTPYPERTRNIRARDEPNEKRIWSPSEPSQRRANFDLDDGKQDQYSEGKSGPNNKYRNDSRATRYDHLEDKENLNNPDKRKSYLTDQDGWLTKVPIQKKAKNEKPFQPAQRATRFGEVQRFPGQQRPLGAAKPYQQGKGREPRREYQAGRQTVVYSNSRGSTFSRKPSTRGIPLEKLVNRSVPRPNEMTSLLSPPSTTISPTLPSTLAIAASASTAAVVSTVAPRSNSYIPPPIIITSTTVCRPDLTPPPPPACGTFSYRDILTKGIQSPSTPPLRSKNVQPTKVQKKEEEMDSRLEMRSESPEVDTFSSVQKSPNVRVRQQAQSTAKKSPVTGLANTTSIPQNSEETEAVQQLGRSSASQPFQPATEVFTTAPHQVDEQTLPSVDVQSRLRCEFVNASNQSPLIPCSDELEPVQPHCSGFRHHLAELGPTQASLMLGVPPGFQNHPSECPKTSFNTSNESLQPSDESNVRVDREASCTVSQTTRPFDRPPIRRRHEIYSEFQLVRNEINRLRPADHGTYSEKDKHPNYPVDKVPEVGKAEFHRSLESETAGGLKQKPGMEVVSDGLENFSHSKNVHSRSKVPSGDTMNSPKRSDILTTNKEGDQNHAPDDLSMEVLESSEQFATQGASSCFDIVAEASSFPPSKVNSESTNPDYSQNNCESSTMNKGNSIKETNNSNGGCAEQFEGNEGVKDLVSDKVLENTHGSDMVAMKDEENESNSGNYQPSNPLSASELLQQIQSSQTIFSKKGVILNRMQENLTLPRNRKNKERAPAPPPTPNDDSYSGGWGSTPIEDPDLEVNPFHLITSAAKELENHSFSSNPCEADGQIPIGSPELKEGQDGTDCLNTNNILEVKDFGNSKSEKEAIQSYEGKDAVSDTFSEFKTDCNLLNNEQKNLASDNFHNSCDDSSCTIPVDQDLNNNTISDVNLNPSQTTPDLHGAQATQRSVPPIVIKPMRKLEAYFPNASQTWTAVSDTEPKIEDTEALPRRLPKTKFRSNDDPITPISSESKEEVLTTQEDRAMVVNQYRENISSDQEKYQIGQPTMVQKLEQSPVTSNREWLNNNEPPSMSPDIYSSMNEDVNTSESCKVNSTNLTKNIAGFTAEIQSSIPSNPNDIWSAPQGKPNLALPKSNLMTMERPETSPLETLLKQSSTTSINRSNVNYFKDTTTKVSVTVPLTSAQLQTTTVTTPKEQISLVCTSSDSNFTAVPKVADVPSQPSFMPNAPNAVQQPVVSTSPEMYHFMPQGSNVLSGRSSNILPAIPPLMQTPSLNPYQHQSPLSVPSQMSLQAQELDYQQLSRMNSGQNANLSQQPPHLNYVQPPPPPPPAAPLQYPSMFDPRWSNNYSLDVNQSEWLNINRFPNSEREFARPPQLHPLSQPVNLFNYPPSSMPPPKDGIFPNFNYPPPTFQPGYRLQTLPGFLQRPPPPLPPQYNSGYYNRAMDTRTSPSLRPPLRESPNRRDQSFGGGVRNKLDGDRPRQPGHLQTQFGQDVGNKTSPNETYTTTNQFSGGGNINSDHNLRYDLNHGNKLQRPGASRQPHDPTLADYIPRNLDAYNNKTQPPQEASFNSSWKQKNLYNDKRAYGSGGRRNFKPDHKEDVPYPPLPSSETYSESETQMGGSRRKNTFKANLSTPDPGKCNKANVPETKPTASPMDYHKHEKPQIQMQYSNPNEVFLAGQGYPNIMPPLEFGHNPIAFGYTDTSNDPMLDKMSHSVADYTGVSDKPECEEAQLSHLGSAFDSIQDFCSGGWKYYHETITSPSGLRIHQSTYVPYPNPCGSMTTAYLSTNDVRARIQWLGFKKANEMYTAKINAQRSLRMDVTVVCSKGGAVCCNSDILGTCSAYFHDRLFGRTDEYITIFVNVPSKIMKHFLQMMSCGEVFVPINDVNEVIMKAPIYLNLNM